MKDNRKNRKRLFIKSKNLQKKLYKNDDPCLKEALDHFKTPLFKPRKGGLWSKYIDDTNNGRIVFYQMYGEREEKMLAEANLPAGSGKLWGDTKCADCKTPLDGLSCPHCNSL